MIKATHGDLLKTKAEALVNTVNCVGVMGKGVALQFKKAYPANFKAYATACKNGEVRPGRMFVFDTGEMMEARWIINFPTKRHWKGRSRLEDVDSGLESLVDIVKALKIKSIAIPPLGCGNGGLDWHVVRSRIEQAFSKMPDVEVKLFEPVGAPKPEEMTDRRRKPILTVARALFIKLLDLYRIADYRLSPLEIQKLAYFLQEAGEPLKLNYVRHKYGPYASELSHVLNRLEGHYIGGFGDNTGRAHVGAISLMPQAVSEADQTLLTTGSDESLQRLARVGKLIVGFESPYGMELLATVHWASMKVENPPASVEEAIPIVQSWSARKAELFTPGHINKAYQRLLELGWFAKID